MNTVILEAGTLSMQEKVESDVTEVQVIKVIDHIQKEKVIAILNVGRLVLWKAASYRNRKESGGWTDADVESRVKNRIENGHLIASSVAGVVEQEA
jgi:hypothetical protein